MVTRFVLLPKLRGLSWPQIVGHHGSPWSHHGSPWCKQLLVWLFSAQQFEETSHDFALGGSYWGYHCARKPSIGSCQVISNVVEERNLWESRYKEVTGTAPVVGASDFGVTKGTGMGGTGRLLGGCWHWQHQSSEASSDVDQGTQN